MAKKKSNRKLSSGAHIGIALGSAAAALGAAALAKRFSQTKYANSFSNPSSESLPFSAGHKRNYPEMYSEKIPLIQEAAPSNFVYESPAASTAIFGYGAKKKRKLSKGAKIGIALGSTAAAIGGIALANHLREKREQTHEEALIRKYETIRENLPFFKEIHSSHPHAFSSEVRQMEHIPMEEASFGKGVYRTTRHAPLRRRRF
jgi:homoserine kinase